MCSSYRRLTTDAEPTSPSPPVTVPPPHPSTAPLSPTVTAGTTPLVRLTAPIAPGKSACAGNIPPSATAVQPRLPWFPALPPLALPGDGRAVAAAAGSVR